MKYIVYVTRGEYSDYKVDEILIGDIDPSLTLDDMTVGMSEGRITSFKDLCSDDWWYRYSHAERCHLDKIGHQIKAEALKALKAKGFVSAEATELFMGALD